MMRVAFRADASLAIGTGHVIRCLTLAHALRERGAECRFVCREHDGHLLDRIRGGGFEAIGMPRGAAGSSRGQRAVSGAADADWLGADWLADATQTIAAVGAWKPHWMVVDHYAIDARWESQLRGHCNRIMVIDDLADRDHDCHLLLDQNLVADFEHRYDRRISPHCARLLGPSYALLQQPYVELRPRTPPRLGPVRRILVSFGGADAPNLTGRTIDAFLSLDWPEIALDVVINPTSPHATTVRSQVRAHERIALHEALPSLAHLMLKADFAIGAAGATSWERCCMGLPSLVATLAENQRPIAKALEQHGLARWVGHHDTVPLRAIAEALKTAVEESDLRQWSQRCLELVDGTGARRVAAIMSLHANTSLNARLALLSDEAMLLRWANDPFVRGNSFNSEPIDSSTHRRWFYDRLRAPERCRIYIVEAHDGLSIGQVRFDRSGDEWEMSFALAPEARGHGLGKQIVQAALRELRRPESDTIVCGRVKPENRRSQIVFEELGFTSERRGAQLVYRRAFEEGV